MLPTKSHPETKSFYHLPQVGVDHLSCQGLACFVARHLNQERWRSASTQSCRLHCLGKCFAGPASADENPRPNVAVHAREAVLLSRIVAGGARSIGQYTTQAGYHGLSEALRKAPDQVITEMERSQLRGRGGAGFPTGMKWRMAAGARPTERFIVANADEGDPGAFSDRFLMEEDPHALIEGMIIAGYATGARRGWIYLRGEYPIAAEVLATALTEAKAAGFLGERILGSDHSFEIELVIGAGSYICGEETALLNSIEGKRPVAMSRPPYATESGLFGKPTVINNVETLCNVPWIMRHGGEAYRALGFSKSRGTKLISLNSLFRRPGLYEIEFGMSVRQIVEEIGGGLTSGTIHGLMIGGPLAAVIPPSQFDTAFGFEELASIGACVGHGGVVAFDEHTSIVELAHHIFTFAADESCGKCTPCRLGTRRVQRILENPSSSGDEEIEQIVAALQDASLCGFGIAIAEFATSVLRHYRQEFERCLA